MSRQKVTSEAVRLAIQSLKEQGQEPSINKVLDITGGSKSTVAAIMREINAEADTTKGDVSLPPAVLAAMERFAGEIWQVADAAAKAQFEEETRRYLARAKAYEDQIAELADTSDNADEARDVAFERIVELEARIRDLEAERSKTTRSLNEHIERLNEHIERLEEAREQLEVADTINEELKAELRAAQQDAAFERRQARQQAEMLVRFEARWDSLVASQAAMGWRAAGP